MADPFEFNMVAPAPDQQFVPANPWPAQQGYQTGPQATFVASVTHNNQIGSMFSGLPADAAHATQNFDTEAAVATLAADGLAGTVPPADVGILANAHVPLRFINNDTLEVQAPGNTWDYHAPTPFIIPTRNEMANSGYQATGEDWGAVVTAAAGLAGGAILGGPAIGQALVAFSAVAPGAFSGAFSRVGHDIMQGTAINEYNMQHGLPIGSGF